MWLVLVLLPSVVLGCISWLTSYKEAVMVDRNNKGKHGAYKRILELAERTGLHAMDASEAGDPTDPDFVYWSAMHEAFMEALDILDDVHVADLLLERGRCNPLK